MNKVKKIKNLFITSFVLFFLTNYSLKLVKGYEKASSIIKRHQLEDKHFENIVAHRGFSGLYPENTLRSIDEASKLDCCDMIEVDIRFTKNNILVLHHDSIISLEDILVQIEDIDLSEIDEELIIKNYPFYNLSNLTFEH